MTSLHAMNLALAVMAASPKNTQNLARNWLHYINIISSLSEIMKQGLDQDQLAGEAARESSGRSIRSFQA